MFKVSILRAKIKRSKVNLKDTYFWNSDTYYSNDNPISKLFLNNEEEVILHYIKSKKYKWILTNRRLIFPNYFREFELSELVHVDFNNVKDNPDEKMTNTELTLHTKDEDFKIFLEEGTWHLFYDIFKFIIGNNSN